MPHERSQTQKNEYHMILERSNSFTDIKNQDSGCVELWIDSIEVQGKVWGDGSGGYLCK